MPTADSTTPGAVVRLAAVGNDRRPGGLTVLAILGFVWGGILLLSDALLLVFILTHNDAQVAESTSSVDRSMLVVNAVGALVCGLLLVLAGVGYLGQRRVLGRYLGTAYSVATLALFAVEEVLEPRLFSFQSVIGVVYAVLILLLVNSTFRRDLVR